jgi:hypothetical protein
MSQFYCTAPSCSHRATHGQFCDVHAGKAVQWYTAVRADGSKLNVRCESQAKADALASNV